MRKTLTLILAIVCLTAALTGCGDDGGVTETTIEVKKNGSVVHTIVEEFSEEYYDLEELMDVMQESCEAYNGGAGKKAVTVGNVEVTDGVLTAVMNYASVSDYASFNGQALFAGSIKDAYNAGYSLDVTLQSAREGGDSIAKEDLLNMGEQNLVIIREDVAVKMWGKALYYTQDVEPAQDARTVRVTDPDTLSYIVFD
ncbi:MAG TPA: hypothetical protein H9763_07170 [Candidatus Eisenbergiella merdigallinarum]|uniref:Uncharacterized protein n=1 Tax=Candidatus Eisenbergiella merdigallinarum TaxID=2838552 RepID=A0A9D2MSN0_9FIRM|nr:hypothetical protein [Candidatus Eisenbergiella merdigallinarum]